MMITTIIMLLSSFMFIVHLPLCKRFPRLALLDLTTGGKAVPEIFFIYNSSFFLSDQRETLKSDKKATNTQQRQRVVPPVHQPNILGFQPGLLMGELVFAFRLQQKIIRQ